MPDSPSAWLRSLAAEATPGPWCFNDSSDTRGSKGEFRAPDPFNGFMLVGPWTNDNDARLIALAPDLAVLCADAIDALEFYGEASNYRGSSADVGERRGPSRVQREKGERARAALARFAALQPDNTKEET